MAVIGIDLGTTYSVVGTPQKREGKYFETIGGITIIKDDYAQRLHPSVVALDRQGNLLVGRRAKNRAGMKPEPIMFAKRFMGQEIELHTGDRVMRPEQVSAEVLRYLKQLAEKQLGEPIEAAVITVPAYFTILQKQKTKEAGEMAGLNVGEILQEPVAAALSYLHDDERDPITIMTYDLGGGTFDTAILGKKDGMFEIKAFDGDANLGGCDFDKKLSFWIIDRLKEQGFQLKIEPGSPEWHKIMVWAETLKIKLTDRESSELMEPNTGITDANGEPVSIEVQISRQDFEQLIREDIEKTIYCCRRALEKTEPPISPDKIAEIVMVGGSSRIPMVAQRLEEEFGTRPKLQEPELSVGIGAAIMARRLPRQIGPLKLGYLPEVTPLSTIQVTGTLEPNGQISDITGCTVSLSKADGNFHQQQHLHENGGFLFTGVPLAAESANTFTLKVEDAGQQEIIAHTFTIRRSTDAQAENNLDGLETNILAKPISIMTVSGLHLAAAERTPLPYKCFVPAQTTDQTGEVKVPVYEGDTPIGEIMVRDVPTDLPIGTGVEISLIMREDFFIDGKTTIPGVGREGHALIRIPLVKVKEIHRLKADYTSLQQRAKEALVQADTGQAFSIAPRLKATLEESRKILYDERSPNLAKSQELLAEAETLIRKLSGWHPNPPEEHFEIAAAQIREELLPRLNALSSTSEEKGYQEQLKAIQRIGKQALLEKNETLWSDANHRLEELKDRVIAAVEREERKKQQTAAGSGKSAEEKPDPRAIKLQLNFQLTHFRDEARKKGRLPELDADISACQKALRDIDATTSDAMVKLADYYENRHQPLEARVTSSKINKSSLPGGYVQTLENSFK
jgi:molecular chaperone DnaK (HSP70)